MPETERDSEYLQSMLTAISERIRRADAYFAENPVKAENPRFIAIYNELKTRQTFISEAVNVLELMTRNSTNTDKALEYCEALYNYSVGEWMYNTADDVERYIDAIILLQKQFPEWDQKITFAIRNITRTTQRGYTLNRYHKTLRVYVDTVVQYFLWLREMYAPIERAAARR